jgi:hypothetical protein
MTDKEQKELQKTKTWDWDRAEAHPGHKKPRAVVSVAFNRDDFETVALYAERAHMRVSEFIRSAALGCAEGRYLVVIPSASSPDAGSTVYLSTPPMPTDAPAFQRGFHGSGDSLLAVLPTGTPSRPA